MKHAITLIAVLLIGCGPSAEQIDRNQVISQENAEYNAKPIDD